MITRPSRAPRLLLPGGALVALGSLLLALAAALPARAADFAYQVQRIATVGDTIAGLPISRYWWFQVGVLNDQGQLAFQTGPLAAPGGELLVYAGGTFTPVVVSGQEGPLGKWPQNSLPGTLPQMNQRGNVAVNAPVTLEGKTSAGNFLWEAQTQKFTPVALPGMPAVNGLTFLPTPLPGFQPWVNNQDEVAFGATIADAAGKARPADFFLGRDHVLRPVVLPDQPLPGGGTLLQVVGIGSLTDAGVIAFRARRAGDPGGAFSAYQWENGTLTPLALVGAAAPGGGTITRVSTVRLNNQNRSALLVLHVSTTPTQAGLYRFAAGQLTAVAVPGQSIDSGQLATVLEEYQSSAGNTAAGDVSPANGLGRHLFRARLADGMRALYRLDPDGTVTLLFKQGSATELGPLTNMVGGQGIGFNSRGQIALPLRLADGPQTLALLTPTTP